MSRLEMRDECRFWQKGAEVIDPGHVQDAATGLVHMQQRYYDPMLGLFLSIDPVTAYSGNMRRFNRYVYAFNSPYKFTDPSGLAV